MERRGKVVGQVACCCRVLVARRQNDMFSGQRTPGARVALSHTEVCSAADMFLHVRRGLLPRRYASSRRTRCGACWTWARRTTTPRSTRGSPRCRPAPSSARACLRDGRPGIRREQARLSCLQSDAAHASCISSGRSTGGSWCAHPCGIAVPCLGGMILRRWSC